MGETVTKTCCGTPCTQDWEPPTAEDVSSHFWCTCKHLCVHQNSKFKHATGILDVIMLQYPVKVCPMPGMWIQSIPVTAIPWGCMNLNFVSVRTIKEGSSLGNVVHYLVPSERVS